MLSPLRSSSVALRRGHAHQGGPDCSWNCLPPDTRLEYLHRLIPQEDRFAADTNDMSWLSVYGIERWWESDEGQARQALQIVQRVRAAAMRTLRDRESRPAPELSRDT